MKKLFYLQIFILPVRLFSSVIGEAIKFAFDTYDIDRIFARPFGSNYASQRVLEKNGFVLEGKLERVIIKHNEYLDELIYGIRREFSKRIV